jgi:CheY-like chemotaxis protein
MEGRQVNSREALLQFLEGDKVFKRTILLVEDDAVIRDIIRSAFEREYNVLEASRCSEALEILISAIDIALIDYMLPDGDGIDLLRAIRQVKSALPVLIMTAYSSEDVISKALRAGATDYVRKPLVLAYLRRRVSDLLARREEDEAIETLEDRESFVLDGIAVFMEDNYSSDITLDQLAERACMNKFKFSKSFNERFGQWVGEAAYSTFIPVGCTCYWWCTNWENSIHMPDPHITPGFVNGDDCECPDPDGESQFLPLRNGP